MSGARTVPAVWATAAAAYAERTAVEADGASLTYAELDAASARVASALAHGDPSNRPVAIDAVIAPETIVLLFGALRAGRPAAMLDPRDPPAYRAEVCAFLGATEVALDDARAHDAATTTTLPEAEPESPSVIYLTSGTTGVPKAVVRSHANLVYAGTERFDLTHDAADTRNLLLYPLAFGASALHVFSTLFSGATLCLYDVGARGADALLPWMRDHRITRTGMIPSLARAVADARAITVPTVRELWTGGEAVHGSDIARLHRVFPNARIVPLYGANESGVVAITELAPGAPRPDGPLLFPPAPEERITILDDDGRELPAGEPGAIVVSGPGVALGYWGDPPEHAGVFGTAPDGARTVRMGDRGLLHPDGRLEVLGRLDARVKVRGQGVEPSMVEAALLQIPGVHEAVVSAVTGADGTTRLVAHVVLDGDEPFGVPELRRTLAQRVPRYAVPGRVRLLDALPRTPRDKVDRRALDTAAVDAVRHEVEYVAPRDDVEARAAAIVADVLGLDRVGLADDFFDAGGDSLAAVELVTALEDELGVDVRALLVAEDDVVGTVTVAAIADQVRAGRTPCSTPSDRVLVRLTGTDTGTDTGADSGTDTAGPPVFLLPGMGGDPIVLRALARRLRPRRVYSAWPHGYVQRALPDQSVEAIARRFAAALTRREPTGPVVVGGYSFGAYVAYEMARQLRAAGRAVALLVIIDTPCGPVRLEVAHNARAEQAERRTRRRADGVAQWLAGAVAYRVDRAALMTTVGLVRRPYPEQGRAYVAHHARVARRYRVRGYGGPTLVLASERRHRLEPGLGWRGVVTGPIETVLVAGTHMTLLREPHVDDVARAINDALDATDREPP